MISRFLLFFAIECFAFTIATLNFRYCAKGHTRATLITDMLIAGNGFVVIKLVSDAQSLWEMAGYILGGAAGSAIGMRLTRGLGEATSQPSASLPTEPSSSSRS